MQLKIENCGKIKKADITINGITVIAGENNTGKSTVGKILYSIFNSFCDLDKKIFESRISSINKIALNSFPVFGSDNDFFINSNRISKLKVEYSERDLLEQKVTEFLQRFRKHRKLSEEDYKKLQEAVNERINISNESLSNNIFNRYIEKEFLGQINSLNNNGNSIISLILKNKSIVLDIKNNRLESFKKEMNILNEAVYIDSPFVIDQLNERGDLNFLFLNVDNDEKNHRDYLDTMLRRKKNRNVVDETIIQQKIQKIIDRINLVAPNASINKFDSQYTYKDDMLDKPLNISNISTGLKTFIIIKMLIENFTIRENGVLILDEPEIHLHPEWQLVFAEIIVLLQKELNLHIILNTHSPYFLNAIEIYSAKHCIADRCKYYLAYNNGKFSEFEDVTDNTEKIYQKLAKPFQKLEDEKTRLGECDD